MSPSIFLPISFLLMLFRKVCRSAVAVGKRVFVPFGRRKRTGFIITISSTCDLAKVKSIQEILDDEPLFSSAELDFYSWIADYFMYPLGKTLAELIPAGSEKKDFLWITPLKMDDDLILSPAQKNLFSLIAAISPGHYFKQSRQCQQPEKHLLHCA